jgi:hypothetical protein
MRKNKDEDARFVTTLTDPMTKKKREVVISVVGGQLLIHVEGYGDKCSINGEGQPIMLDWMAGRLEVIVWSNINEEDPTHYIRMEGAMESERIEEDDNLAHSHIEHADPIGTSKRKKDLEKEIAISNKSSKK